MSDNDIILRPYDLCIKTIENGTKLVQLKSSVAFDTSFLKDCESKGVSEYIEYKKED